MSASRAGQLPTSADLVDVAKLVTAYFTVHPDPEDPGQRVFFSPIGMAIEDICLSYRVFRLAEQKGIGTRLKLF